MSCFVSSQTPMSPCKPNFEILVMTTMILCAYSKPVLLFHHCRFYTSTVPMSSHELAAVEWSLISLTVVCCMIMLTYMAHRYCCCYYHFIMILSILYFHFLNFYMYMLRNGNVVMNYASFFMVRFQVIFKQNKG